MVEKTREVPFRDLKVRDLFKSRHSDSEVILDGDREVLRITRNRGKKPPFCFYFFFRNFSTIIIASFSFFTQCILLSFFSQVICLLEYCQIWFKSVSIIS